ncbi:transcriptional regulator, AraC family [Pseudopedobacter saltans DSM 12145]|uniref:Transcriptional regulator, AraC family n=1 Tax=Pseudopedobacter saltans (strain ATCC 51119 / DSM 12145 / JCM 21818 / CCUG 39354 / LMG 10337 / NBRC 100064 / NCIMB 13643) TaxID=762903 RepID=F0S687_PSESL|nr:AraC family transcriptional regulator [Pseudopedobacter saltans]ADY53201.1 transcriptional regulator, AraC family [Pseudopedobacter saltans DSM 12145]
MVKQIDPCPLLNNCIDNYMFVDIDWSNNKHIDSIWRLIPFGQISALFLYGDLHGYSDHGDSPLISTPRSFIVGQLTKPLWLSFSGHTRLVKIQFKPAGAQQLIHINLSELTNNPCIPLENLWGYHTDFLLEQLHDADSDNERAELLNKFFIKRLSPSNLQATYIDYTLQQLYRNNGSYKLQHLEQKLGISGRQLERIFKSHVGLKPKDISRSIRMNTALTLLCNKPETSLSNLAYELGYYDPAHFSKDFSQLTGLLPSKLKNKPQKELVVTHGKCFYS